MHCVPRKDAPNVFTLTKWPLKTLKVFVSLDMYLDFELGFRTRTMPSPKLRSERFIMVHMPCFKGSVTL